ncbi:MAG: glycoside hydrolase family 127 protein [Verrucomicrobia bacterium]|nr:glycoside hydrolase family 127 protein [Verrucomicrobiota bacterium]
MTRSDLPLSLLLAVCLMRQAAGADLAPLVAAGLDRTVVLPGATYLTGVVRADGRPGLTLQWAKLAGPGAVAFSNPAAAATAARFAAVGEYVLQLSAADGKLQAAATVRVTAVAAPPAPHLEPVWSTAYQLSSPFWRKRTKNLIVNWLPHCVGKLCDPATREGSIEDFVLAGRKLAGTPGVVHAGPGFCDWFLYNTAEAMCLALLVDPQGDPEIIAAQNTMRLTLDDWIPKILSAQEPDGYLLTQATLQGRPHWRHVRDHEGYQAGYFIEFAIAHHLLTGGRDRRLLDAAIRLADCWVRNLGPAPKQRWYDGHQGIEFALVRLARHLEGGAGPNNNGAAYLALAKFLLDSRGNGEEYDQTHLPVTRQYAAVGHAVRAVYGYTGMADIAMETGDADYRSAVQSLWSNLVNRQYYVTGGLGSGDTNEGFGQDFSLPNNAYGESCAACGEVFFQHRMQLTWHDAAYADLLEEALYNAVLGSVDLAARNFTYTNPLDSSEPRYPWHQCPCCVGNIPRTLLSLPTWIYTRSSDALYVNLYLGSRVTIDQLGGTPVQVEQSTEYPWCGKVAITLTPAHPATFTLHLRVPKHQSSALYTNHPESSGLSAITINGQPVTPAVARGYALVTREWQAGDIVAFDLPLPVQRVQASENIAATRGRVALRCGPLVYNLESVDQDVEAVLAPNSPLTTEWQSDLLDGVRVIKGRFRDGTPLLAIPNYARLNRGGRSLVWIRDR